ncbi:MAG: hypothetical protein F4X56_10680 [Gammaproteobacteria bacterium]|nr:hypothetical protein [Gammaproteobacteria bacterium]
MPHATRRFTLITAATTLLSSITISTLLTFSIVNGLPPNPSVMSIHDMTLRRDFYHLQADMHSRMEISSQVMKSLAIAPAIYDPAPDTARELVDGLTTLVNQEEQLKEEARQRADTVQLFITKMENLEDNNE